MPKLKKPKPKEKQGQESGSITFSTRFTEEQRDRVVAAAEIRGWTPSNLMRVATIEKAAHILNTSRKTKFDIERLVSRVVQQLMAPGATTCGPVDQTDQLSRAQVEELLDDALDAGPEGSGHKAFLNALSQDEIDLLKQGARLGGAELLNMIIQACESLATPDRKDLPEPIDPV